MSTQQIRALLRIKRIIDQLRAIDQDTLTPTEREALQDMLAQAYDSAAYLLRKPQYAATSRKEANNYENR